MYNVHTSPSYHIRFSSHVVSVTVGNCRLDAERWTRAPTPAALEKVPHCMVEYTTTTYTHTHTCARIFHHFFFSLFLARKRRARSFLGHLQDFPTDSSSKGLRGNRGEGEEEGFCGVQARRLHFELKRQNNICQAILVHKMYPLSIVLNNNTLHVL